MEMSSRRTTRMALVLLLLAAGAATIDGVRTWPDCKHDDHEGTAVRAALDTDEYPNRNQSRRRRDGGLALDARQVPWRLELCDGSTRIGFDQALPAEASTQVVNVIC